MKLVSDIIAKGTCNKYTKLRNHCNSDCKKGQCPIALDYMSEDIRDTIRSKISYKVCNTRSGFRVMNVVLDEASIFREARSAE